MRFKRRRRCSTGSKSSDRAESAVLPVQDEDDDDDDDAVHDPEYHIYSEYLRKSREHVESDDDVVEEQHGMSLRSAEKKDFCALPEVKIFFIRFRCNLHYM